MSLQQQLRTSGKSHTTLFQENALKDMEDQIISSVSLRSHKTLLPQGDEQQLFTRLLVFLKQFFGNEKFHKRIASNLKKCRSADQISPKSPGSCQNERILSFKKMNMGSRICFEGEVTRKDSPIKNQVRGVRGNNKKISIFVMEEDYSEQSEDIFSESLVSQNSVKTIRSIEIPQMDMNCETIAQIFETPQPFLINLSLCLMVRYCLASKRKVCFEDSAWVLSVSTIVGYKLFYDEQIEGLMDCFMDIMKINRKDLIDLERCFLEEIEYNTVIYNRDYHFILAELLSVKQE